MAEQQTFASLGKMEAIRQLFEGTGYKPFEEPLQFDPAAKSSVCAASRSFLEGVDFNLVYFPLKHLGFKAVLAATAELFASMAHPRTLQLCLGVSAKLDFDQVKQLWSGVLSAAREYGYNRLALDLQPSRNGLSISVTAVGETLSLTKVRRSKAKSMDLICISGALGAAYMGLQVLEREKVRFDAGARTSDALEQYKMLVGSYLKPELSSGVVSALEEAEIYPSYGYAVSHGLSDALLRLSRDSALGAKVYADKLPFEGNTFSLGEEMDIDPVSAAMNGGDDFRLLFTIPILQMEKFHKNFPTFDIIGHLALPEAGTVLVTPDGVELPVKAQGW